MSIWNDPIITFQQFADYLNDAKNKESLNKIWTKKTKNKTLLSDVEMHEMADILVSFQKQCIKSINDKCEVKSDQLRDTAHLFSDWIVENKLSGIPMNDAEDYNTQKLSDIFNNNVLFQWISESAQPLQTYTEFKSKHNPSLSQQEIKAKNKRIVENHPSLAFLFAHKVVNDKQSLLKSAAKPVFVPQVIQMKKQFKTDSSMSQCDIWRLAVIIGVVGVVGAGYMVYRKVKSFK